MPNSYAISLCTILILFFLRVCGQLIVCFFPNNGFLPPMSEWYSGLIAYPWLLFSQIIILLLLSKVCLAFLNKRPPTPSRLLGKLFTFLGFIYFLVMITRYVIRMSLYPDERWIGGSIPIILHCCLALFLIILGIYHLNNASKPAKKPSSKFVIFCKTVGVLLLLVFYCLWVAFQTSGYLLSRILHVKPGTHAVRVERAVVQAMNDNVKLRSDLYLPYRLAKAPTILVRIPYSRHFYDILFSNVIGKFWAEHGYYVVVQGTRGKYQSDGEYYPLVPERADGIATLTWISKQPWYNGKIGMWGGSYFGYTQWVLTDNTVVPISAMMIQIASTSFYNMFYPGGAFALESALYWAVESSPHQDITPDMKNLNRAFNSTPLIDMDIQATGKKISFLRDWMTHSTDDSYWQTIDGKDRAKNLNIPVLMMAGWFDPFLASQIADYASIHDNKYLIIGPWSHAKNIKIPFSNAKIPYRLESLRFTIPWFDQWLQASTHTPLNLPKVKIFIFGKNIWRDENEWPLARAVNKQLYLRSHGDLSFDPPGNSSVDTFIYNPLNPVPTHGGAVLSNNAGMFKQNDVEARQDVLVYTSKKLDTPIEITGPIKLILYVSSSAACTDFTGKLVDVYPDGSAYNLTDAIIRSHFDSTHDIHKIEIDFGPMSNFFQINHRIRLEVSSSNFPRFDRNHNTCDNPSTAIKFDSAQQTIYHSSDSPSHLIIPVVGS